MRNLASIGIVLIVIGIVALVVQNVRFTETRKVVDLGPLQVRSEEQHNIPIPTVAGIAAVVAGLGLRNRVAPASVAVASAYTTIRPTLRRNVD